MLQRLLVLVVLTGAAAGSAWLLLWLSEEPVAGLPSDRRVPDYYMEDFTTLTMREDGKPGSRLTATYLAHYPDDDTTELLKPDLEFFREGRQPLYVSAEKARRRGGDDTIHLLGVVRIWQYDETGAPTLEVSTADVSVSLDSEYAETEQYATIMVNNATITGTGMRVFLPESRLEVIKHEKTLID